MLDGKLRFIHMYEVSSVNAVNYIRHMYVRTWYSNFSYSLTYLIKLSFAMNALHFLYIISITLSIALLYDFLDFVQTSTTSTYFKQLARH